MIGSQAHLIPTVHYPGLRENFWIEKEGEKSPTQTQDKISHDQAKKGARIFCRSKNKCFKQAIALKEADGYTNLKMQHNNFQQ